MRREEEKAATREIDRGDNGDMKEQYIINITLDCHNIYETVVGIFEGAVPLEKKTFCNTWVDLKKKMKDTTKDAPTMTYCTG